MSDTLRHTPDGVFLGHMLAFDHGIHNDTPVGAEYEKALARAIFGGECWAIGKCTCLWVLAIRVVIGLTLGPKRHVFDLWHVYGAGPDRGDAEVTDYIAEQAILVPQPWDEGGRVHNWRNHVGEHVRALWNSFSDEQKIAIARDADELASAEYCE